MAPTASALRPGSSRTRRAGAVTCWSSLSFPPPSVNFPSLTYVCTPRHCFHWHKRPSLQHFESVINQPDGYCALPAVHHAQVCASGCALCSDPTLSLHRVILPCQLYSKARLQREVHRRCNGLAATNTKQAEVFLRRRPSEDKGRNTCAVITGRWKERFQINTRLQYASTTASAVSQSSARMEINDAALSESTSQGLCEIPSVPLTFSCQASPEIQCHSLCCLHRKPAAQCYCRVTRSWDPNTHKEAEDARNNNPMNGCWLFLEDCIPSSNKQDHFCCCPAANQGFPHLTISPDCFL